MKVFDPLKKERAFTLLEVLISLVILSVGMLGVLSLTVSVVQGNAFGKRMTVAATLAQDKLEELKKLPYSSADLDPVTTKESDLVVNGVSGYYQRVTAVTDDSPTNNTKKIEVTVNWVDPQSRSITLTTFVAR